MFQPCQFFQALRVVLCFIILPIEEKMKTYGLLPVEYGLIKEDPLRGFQMIQHLEQLQGNWLREYSIIDYSSQDLTIILNFLRIPIKIASVLNQQEAIAYYQQSMQGYFVAQWLTFATVKVNSICRFFNAYIFSEVD
ncbi:hypothetical protein STEG23_002699 [Scotinomys teguina]